MPSAEGRWALRAPAGLRWRVFGDEHVLYDGRTGDTHLLEPGAAEILRALAGAPRSEAELAEHLARWRKAHHTGRGAGQDRPAAADYVPALVQRLARAGVITRARI